MENNFNADEYACDRQFQDDIKNVDAINRRHIGRLILKHCGNEGTDDDEQKASMRRLLQEVIDYLPREKEKIWSNADVTLYDIDGNRVQITSGSAKHKFLVQHGFNGETIVRKVQRSVCTIS